MKLTESQRIAVEHNGGPLLIVAGAGTGKTTVITQKIKALIESGVDPQEILALTFSEKAAKEMLERLDEVMPYGYEEPWVSTFHRFGQRALQNEGLEIGIDPGFEIISGSQQYLLIKNHLFEFELNHYRPLGNPNKFISALITLFSRCGDEGVGAGELMEYAAMQQCSIDAMQNASEREEVEKLMEVAKAYQKYEELKINESVLDFGDLIGKTWELFKTRPSVLAKYQNKFKHVLVDEFQDTNFAQYQLVKLLCTPGKESPLTVVGDDSQSIYRFRGAAISNILQFMDDYKNATQVVLTENYRSNQTILDGAYRLIQHNNPETLEVKLGISKELVSSGPARDEPGEALVIEAKSETDEVEFVVERIKTLVSEEGLGFADVAIIARSNAALDVYAQTFQKLGLPFRRIGNRGLFDRSEVLRCLRFLEVIVDTGNDSAVLSLLLDEHFEIPTEVVLKAVRQARLTRESLWSLVVKSEEVVSVAELVTSARLKVKEETASNLVFWFLQESGFLQKMVSENAGLEEQMILSNLQLFLKYLKNLEMNGKQSVVELVEELERLSEAGENPSQAEVDDVEAITLTTAHSAKGLEFEAVFVVGLVAGRFPSYNRKDPIELPEGVLKERLPKEDNTAEERRLFYVAMTRARRYLYLTYASDYGGVRARKPSGFVKETGLSVKLLGSDGFTRVKDESVGDEFGEYKSEFVLRQTSFSQLDTFDVCPLKYKYRYVLKVPAAETHALAFGKTIHKTLQNFHTREMAGEELSENDLLEIYKECFIGEGYESAAHKKERFEQGREALKNYFVHYKSEFGKPFKLEQKFSLKIAGVEFIGNIDRIDKMANGKYEIVDYKTGSAQKKKQVDKDEQLTIYALAARDALKLNVDKLSLYFIENNQKISTSRTDKQLDKKLVDLEKKIEEIKTSEFKPTPGFACQFCEFRKICKWAEK